jgi:hypothetical protein
MIWLDYTVEQAGDNFRVKGDWPGEVMGKQEDGTEKGYALYRPGDVFIVNEAGWLVKSDHLSSLMIKYESAKKQEC